MKRYRPYRLLSNKDLNTIRTKITSLLQSSVDSYFSLPIEILLVKEIDCSIDDFYLLGNNASEALALIGTDYQEVLGNLLFINSCCCFTATIEQIAQELLGAIIQSPVRFYPQPIDRSDWCYQGSPCCQLLFRFEQHQLQIILHPQVIMQLLQHPIKKKPMANLAHVFNHLNLLMDVKLPPFQLRLDELQQLKKGDIIKTDHPLTKPLLLKNKQQLICSVQTGKQSLFKSIQLLGGKHEHD